MIIINRSINIILICSLSLLLESCSGDNTNLYKYIYDIKTRPPRPIEPIPKFAPLPKFKFPEYDNRRSPFKPVEFQKTSDRFAPDQNRVKEPLEAFPLDALKFVGTLKEANAVWALIKQPDKQITRIKIGNYMGQNFGHVIAIKDDFIKLEETLKVAGKWEKQITTLNLVTGK